LTNNIKEDLIDADTTMNFEPEFSNDANYDEHITDDNNSVFDAIEQDENENPRGIRGKPKDYSGWKNFKSHQEYQQWWATEKDNWKQPKRTHGAEYWYCKFSRRKNYQCDMALLINFLETEVVVLKSAEHDHQALNIVAMSEATKEIIKELMAAKYKPAQIHRELFVRF
jgi:hypothetical protein